MTSIFGFLVTYVQNSAKLLNRKRKDPSTVKPGLHNVCKSIAAENSKF